MKSKIEEIEWLKKSKFEEVKDWRSKRIEESKIEVLETQPESAPQIESRGLLTWVCPLGTHELVYWVRPIKEVNTIVIIY
jgi:hypothetical protein